MCHSEEELNQYRLDAVARVGKLAQAYVEDGRADTGSKVPEGVSGPLFDLLVEGTNFEDPTIVRTFREGLLVGRVEPIARCNLCDYPEPQDMQELM